MVSRQETARPLLTPGKVMQLRIILDMFAELRAGTPPGSG
jgi:hypothetical protein